MKGYYNVLECCHDFLFSVHRGVKGKEKLRPEEVGTLIKRSTSFKKVQEPGSPAIEGENPEVSADVWQRQNSQPGESQRRVLPTTPNNNQQFATPPRSHTDNVSLDSASTASASPVKKMAPLSPISTTSTASEQTGSSYSSERAPPIKRSDSAKSGEKSPTYSKKAKRTLSMKTRRQTQSFKEKYKHPASMPPVEKEGLLERKQELMTGGKKATIRSWKHFYTVLCGQLLCFFRDRQGDSEKIFFFWKAVNHTFFLYQRWSVVGEVGYQWLHKGPKVTFESK